MRQQVALKLIEEVNNKKSINKKQFDNDSDKQLVPREGNIGVRSSLIDYNNSNSSSSESSHIYQSKKTRAQMVPKSETLAPVFKTLSHKN